MTGQLVEEMLNIREQFSAEYERRFFIIGLSKMLMSPQLPPSLQPQLLRLLNELVESITALHDQVTKRVKAVAEKEAKLCESDSDEDEDDDDDSLDDEKEQSDARNATKSNGTKSNGPTEESKSAATMVDDDLGFAEKPDGEDDAKVNGDGGDNNDNDDEDVDGDSDDANAQDNVTDSDDDDTDFEMVSGKNTKLSFIISIQFIKSIKLHIKKQGFIRQSN